MTDRVHSLTVVLDKDVRVDDIEALQNAIRQFKGVIAVEGNIANPDSVMAEQRALTALRDKILAILWPRS